MQNYANVIFARDRKDATTAAADDDDDDDDANDGDRLSK